MNKTENERSTLKSPSLDRNSYNLLKNEKDEKFADLSDSKQKNHIRLPGNYIAQLKSKCLVTVVSLLEGNNPSDGIGLRISRSIPLRILTKNMIMIHTLYQKLYKDDDYNEDAFGHDNIDELNPNKAPKYYECIIEIGFNIFILINIFLDLQKHNNEPENDDELEAFREKDHEKQNNLFGDVFTEFTALGKSVVSLSYGAITDITKKVAHVMNPDTENEFKKLQKALENKQLLKETINFFRDNTRHIEIVKDGRLEKIYFPLLPYCKTLTTEHKRAFHENVNRTSTKTKIAGLMEHSDATLNFMKHEERLRLLFNKYKIIGVIASHSKLWQSCAFYTNIILNAFIRSSYSSKFQGNSNDPHLFMDPNINGTQDIIYLLGCINLAFLTLVVAFTLIKRIPLITGHIWKKFASLSKFQKILKFFVNLVYSLFYCLKDFYFSYYTLFIIRTYHF